MTLNDRSMKAMKWIAGSVLASGMTVLVCGGAAIHGQEPTASKPTMTRTEISDRRMLAPLTTFYLKNSSMPNDGNEVLTGLRLMLDPSIKLYLVPSQKAIVLKALPDEVAEAKKLIEELDRPRKVYRLTYALTEMDGAKRLGTQHYVVVVIDGQRMTLKAGSKVPVITGRYNEETKGSETQMTYLDIGYNFDTTLNESADGAVAKVKVERSAVAEEKPAAGAPQDPSIRQAVLDGVSYLALGKPQLLGSLDVPDSTRRVEIEATLEVVQ